MSFMFSSPEPPPKGDIKSVLNQQMTGNGASPCPLLLALSVAEPVEARFFLSPAGGGGAKRRGWIVFK